MSTRADAFNQNRQPLFGTLCHFLARSVRMAMSHVGSTTRHWYRNYKTRAQLAHLPDYMLKDVGLKRADAIRESSKPFWRK